MARVAGDLSADRVVMPSRPGWPLVAAAAVTAGIVGFMLRTSLSLTGGELVYAQDDPYIHLAMARTLAEHGTWGIAPGPFVPASSSPAWVVLLATLRTAGLSATWVPLLVNAVAAVLVLVAADWALRRHLVPPVRSAALVAFALVLPLPTLVFIGMEHTAHVAAVVALAAAACSRITEEDRRPRLWASGAVLAFATGAFRYEGLFVVGVVAALLWYRRRRSDALTVLLAGLAAPTLYAAYAVSLGGLPVPNSVLMKSGADRFGSSSALAGVLLDLFGILTLFERPLQAALVIANVVTMGLLARPGAPFGPRLALQLTYFGVQTCHVAFVRLEWFYRYEAYVVALGLLALGLAVGELRDRRDLLYQPPLRRRAAIAGAAVLALPLVHRAGEAAVATVRATYEVHLQQAQLGRLLAGPLAGRTVALNDIGAASWFGRARIVDLVGLASPAVAEARRHGAATPAFYRQLVSREGVDLVAVYDGYLEQLGGPAQNWQVLGYWDSIPSFAVSGDRVTFYATSADAAPGLRGALDAFAPTLPQGIGYRPARLPPGTAEGSEARSQAGSRLGNVSAGRADLLLEDQQKRGRPAGQEDEDHERDSNGRIRE